MSKRPEILTVDMTKGEGSPALYALEAERQKLLAEGKADEAHAVLKKMHFEIARAVRPH